MSSFKVNYYSPNDTNYIATIQATSITDGTNNCTTTDGNTPTCTTTDGNIPTAINNNADLANKIQKANNKNATSLGLYTDSSIFYTMQYIQLWNMAGGIALSGSLIYYLVYVKK